MVAYDTLFSIFIVLTASGAQAHENINGRHIVARQTSSIGNGIFGDGDSVPSQCQNACNPLKNCMSPDCVCDSDNSKALAACFQCAVNLKDDQSTLSAAQNAYNAFADSCNVTGTPVPSVTFKLGSGALSNSAQVWGIGVVSVLSILLLSVA